MALSVDDVARGLVRYAKEPVRFVRDVINATPDPWQEEALQALADGKHVAIRSGNGVGKSALLAWIVIWYLSTRPYPKIPCTAPTLHQFRDVLWSEIAYWLSRSKVKPILTWTAEKVCMAGQEASWFAVARTATDKESLAGFHSPHMLFIVDEASGVEDPTFEAIDGALTTPGALVVMTGNPTRLSGYFYEAFTKHPELWHTIQVSQYDCPRIPRPNIQRLIDSYGEDSNYVRVHVLGQFPCRTGCIHQTRPCRRIRTQVRAVPGRG
jgi:hypothetical protein